MSKIIFADGTKTIHTNKKDYMCVIDNDEYIEMRNTNKLGNCMYKTAKRLNNYVRKYGVNNFGLYLIVSQELDNKIYKHTAIYNRKLNKIIDVSNGRIILMNYEEYIKKTLLDRKTKKYIHYIKYINEKSIICMNMNDKTKTEIIVNDESIKKLDNDNLYDLIMDFIICHWKEMTKKINE